MIVDIEVYQEMLQRPEDIEDINMLAEKRRKPMSFRKLDDFLQEFPRRI